MKRRFAVSVILVLMMVFMSSCGSAPCVTVRDIRDAEKAAGAEKIVFVFDPANRNSWYFREYFLDTFVRLTQDTPKQLSVMTGYEYAHSPYYESDRAGAFDDVLFIVVKMARCEREEYDTYTVTYSMVVQYQDQEPLLIEEIVLGFSNTYFESNDWRGRKLAEIIHEELSKQNIL